MSVAPPTTAGPPEDQAKLKPLMRGWLHLCAFVAMCVAGPILVSKAPTPGATAALVVYVVAVALLFGVSAAFHLKRWSPTARRRMR
ncbi:MAG TPA: hemolysin III family protein, partial [Acidimicrobiales bacterium]|nr:hemolysin III family protein [Acidimicrobiales bacterium]